MAWIHSDVESIALRVAQRKGNVVDLSGLHGDGRLALSILLSLKRSKSQNTAGHMILNHIFLLANKQPMMHR